MIEPSEIARWERNLRTMLRKAADEDPEGFDVVDQLLRGAVDSLPLAANWTRRQHGYSWTDMAHGLGVSRQAARKRLGAFDGSELPAEAISALIADRITYRPRGMVVGE